MEYTKDSEGNKIVTHVRCIGKDSKPRSLALVVVKNSEMMQVVGCTVEDPEYDLYLKEKGVSFERSATIDLSNEASEKLIDISQDRPAIEEFKEVKVKKVAPKKGRKPSKK